MEFGPEIKVDGVRPEWLEDGVKIMFDNSLGYSDARFPGDIAFESHDGRVAVTVIRLPANHPHYATPTPDERAVAPELVERMRKLVTELAAREPYDNAVAQTYEARAIVAALEPVDPMLLEARQVVAGLYEGQGVTHLREQALSGDGDEWFHTKVALAALARGRQLEKEGK